ncbi:hypothetical protein HanIR_Chr16g0833641 [Helianthus annuus]|nr:hypothetical protein HanIR_Chr16g0833641 [Helianthus annuus]
MCRTFWANNNILKATYKMLFQSRTPPLTTLLQKLQVMLLRTLGSCVPYFLAGSPDDFSAEVLAFESEGVAIVFLKPEKTNKTKLT